MRLQLLRKGAEWAAWGVSQQPPRTADDVHAIVLLSSHRIVLNQL